MGGKKETEAVLGNAEQNGDRKGGAGSRAGMTNLWDQ